MPTLIQIIEAIIIAVADVLRRKNHHDYLCSEPIMESIMSSEGANVAVMHGDVIKVFLLDDNYCPMFSCTEINPR